SGGGPAASSSPAPARGAQNRTSGPYRPTSRRHASGSLTRRRSSRLNEVWPAAVEPAPGVGSKVSDMVVSVRQTRIRTQAAGLPSRPTLGSPFSVPVSASATRSRPQSRQPPRAWDWFLANRKTTPPGRSDRPGVEVYHDLLHSQPTNPPPLNPG